MQDVSGDGTKETRLNTFDHATHGYMMDGRPVPSVTQIMDGVWGQPFYASDWHLERGRAVHACCAMIACNRQFQHDPQIDGQVRACRQWFSDMKPAVMTVENARFHEQYQFAGTPDLVCEMRGKAVIIDYKASYSPIAWIQLGGYSLLTGVQKGAIVELHEDGTYKMTPVEKLARFRNEFLATLTVYHIMERNGLRKEKVNA